MRVLITKTRVVIMVAVLDAAIIHLPCCLSEKAPHCIASRHLLPGLHILANVPLVLWRKPLVGLLNTFHLPDRSVAYFNQSISGVIGFPRAIDDVPAGDFYVQAAFLPYTQYNRTVEETQEKLPPVWYPSFTQLGASSEGTYAQLLPCRCLPTHPFFLHCNRNERRKKRSDDRRA